jgi:hypothetical protein
MGVHIKMHNQNVYKNTQTDKCIKKMHSQKYAFKNAQKIGICISKHKSKGVGCMAWEWIRISLHSWMVVL